MVEAGATGSTRVTKFDACFFCGEKGQFVKDCSVKAIACKRSP